jgi:hypothetical protein
METLHQVLASFDIFSVLVSAFPSIFNPLMEGFRELFQVLFSSIKQMVTLNPGLVLGSIFMSLVYFVINTFSRLRKVRA